MILQRYILKDIFSHTAAVSLIFLFIVLASRSIQYLEQVSRGELSVELVLWVIFFRLPEFLQLIIPFGFFLSIVLVVGRLNTDNEMIIFEQNGFSTSKFVYLFILSGISLALITGLLSLWITPIFNEKLDKVYLDSSFEDDFYSIQPGRFNTLDNHSMIYVQEKEDNVLNSVFLKFPDKAKSSTKKFVTAKKAYLSEEQKSVLLLEDGYSFSEDESSRQEMSFETMLINFGSKSSSDKTDSVNNKNLPVNRFNSANFQWNISIPLLCLVSSILAFPLSRVSLRQGRFVKVLPNILVFMSYLGLLVLVKVWMEEGLWPSFPGLFAVHVLFITIGLFLLFKHSRIGRFF